jgi:hypothetical protein
MNLNLLNLGLFVQGMLPIERAIFVHLKLFLGIPPIFRGGIVPPFTLAALQGYQFNHRFLACHNPSSVKK